jgi:hypothetical protein
MRPHVCSALAKVELLVIQVWTMGVDMRTRNKVCLTTAMLAMLQHVAYF